MEGGGRGWERGKGVGKGVRGLGKGDAGKGVELPIQPPTIILHPSNLESASGLLGGGGV